jgi:hypothetical protein
MLYDDGKYVEAIELAEDIRLQYAAVLADVTQNVPLAAQPAARAAALIKHIEDDPAAKAAFQQVRAARLMRQIAVVEEKIADDPTAKVRLYNLYEQVIKYNPLSDHAKLCARKLAEMRNDKELMAQLKRLARLKKARELYQLGQMYEKAKRTDLAQKKYALMLHRYPEFSLEEIRGETDPTAKSDKPTTQPADR